jgi:hypothetical protein
VSSSLLWCAPRRTDSPAGGLPASRARLWCPRSGAGSDLVSSGLGSLRVAPTGGRTDGRKDGCALHQQSRWAPISGPTINGPATVRNRRGGRIPAAPRSFLDRQINSCRNDRSWRNAAVPCLGRSDRRPEPSAVPVAHASMGDRLVEPRELRSGPRSLRMWSTRMSGLSDVFKFARRSVHRLPGSPRSLNGRSVSPAAAVKRALMVAASSPGSLVPSFSRSTWGNSRSLKYQ